MDAEDYLRRQDLVSTTSSQPYISQQDRAQESIGHYEEVTPLVPDTTSWGVQCLRSPTLDQPDDYITDLPLGLISNVTLPNTEPASTWDIELENGLIKKILQHDTSRMQAVGTNAINAGSSLLAPSLCHPHLHLDKAFLLPHPRYSDLQIQRGDFQEAMELTNEAKSRFTIDDLLERGQRVIDESIAAGVTHIRAFVELDVIVGKKCLQAALILKKRAEKRCHVQICAFAQLPLFSSAQSDTDGCVIRGLMEHAAQEAEVEALGSTPYVEDDEEKMQKNVSWTTSLAKTHRKHLDFHLDYNLDAGSTPMIEYVLDTLKQERWTANTGKTVVLGHCTRLTLLKKDDWHELAKSIEDLPVHFVGLPTSDLFMTPPAQSSRGTLDIPQIIKQYGLNGCISINNIGNAFTPYGSCDPLALACSCIGIYRAGTKPDAELLYECISERARQAIGVSAADTHQRDLLTLRSGSDANLLLFSADSASWTNANSISQAVYLNGSNATRVSFLEGRAVEETDTAERILS